MILHRLSRLQVVRQVNEVIFGRAGQEFVPTGKKRACVSRTWHNLTDR